jgi:hypothetical protein
MRDLNTTLNILLIILIIVFYYRVEKEIQYKKELISLTKQTIELTKELIGNK